MTAMIEMSGEPIRCKHRHLIQSPRFLKEVGRPGNDHQFLDTSQLLERLPVEILDRHVTAAH